MKAALEQYLALEQSRHELTLEGLADVDAGTSKDTMTIRWTRKARDDR